MTLTANPGPPTGCHQALDAYHAEHEYICLDPNARNVRHTYVIPSEDKNPGACSKCWWTRKSTMIGWPSSKWIW